MTRLTMLDVYWLEQAEADVPTDNNWLSRDEILHFNGLRIPKRRADWRVGRWTAKCAVAIQLNISDDPRGLANIEIRAATSGAPEVFVAGQQVSCTISLSHSAGRALCAIVPATVALGCDLERIEPRSPAFIADFFTAEEQDRIEQSITSERSALVTLLWSGKESVLKALHTGLRLDTRTVVVEPQSFFCLAEGWHPLRAHYLDNDESFLGWWKIANDFVRTMVSSPQSSEPGELQTVNCHTGRRDEIVACAVEHRAA